MSSPFSLFWFRLKKEWHYQYDVFRSAVDWIIWLYIIVPIIALVFYQYYLLWQGTASWVESVPLPFLFLFLFILCWTGCIRLFLTEGDLLFLRQNKKWHGALMRFGILYSIVLNIFFTMMISAIVIPILYLYAHYSFYQIGLLLSFIYFYRLFIQFVKQIVFVSFSGLQLMAIKVVLFIASLTVYAIFFHEIILVQLLILCIIVFTLPLLYRIRMKRTWCFFEDCVREIQQKLKLIRCLFKRVVITQQNLCLNEKGRYCFTTLLLFSKEKIIKIYFVSYYLNLFYVEKTDLPIYTKLQLFVFLPSFLSHFG